MNNSTLQLPYVLKRKYCKLIDFVSLFSKHYKYTIQETKQLLHELDLHKLAPKDDAVMEYKIQLSDEAIIKNYLSNNRFYDGTYLTKPAMLIKWEKADLINWLRSHSLETPNSWKNWIERSYPILRDHNACLEILEHENTQQDSPSQKTVEAQGLKPSKKTYQEWCKERDALLKEGLPKYFKSKNTPNESEVARTIAKNHHQTPDHVRKMIKKHCKYK